MHTNLCIYSTKILHFQHFGKQTHPNPIYFNIIFHYFIAIQFKLIRLCLNGENRFDLWLAKTVFTYECCCCNKFRFAYDIFWLLRGPFGKKLLHFQTFFT